MPTVRINGAALNYLQVDEGVGAEPREDLIMVHGLATNMAFWYLPYTPVFAKRFRVTLFDLRGLGRSEMTSDGYTPQNLALDLQGLMDHLGISGAHFVAHSFGGVVALNLACLEPSRVKSLVLADTHITAVRRHTTPRDWGNRAYIQSVLDRHGLRLDTQDPYFGYRLLSAVAHLHLKNQSLPPDLVELVGPMMGKQSQRTAAQWVRLMDETQAEAQLMGDDGLSLAALRALTMPILALYGDHSQARLTGGELLEVWPHAEFRRVRDAGHFFPASRPDDVMAECERFWRGEFSRRPEVRCGEVHRRHFRSDRVFKADGQWHFTTRENTRVGPFDTSVDAHEALAQFTNSLVVAA
jgi:pimeloyl-ACP methyl ester carboxylesterase